MLCEALLEVIYDLGHCVKLSSGNFGFVQFFHVALDFVVERVLSRLVHLVAPFVCLLDKPALHKKL